MEIRLSDRVRGLPSVGEKRAALFGKLGIAVVSDLLYDFPRGYQHRGRVLPLAQAADGEVASFILTIASPPTTSLVKSRMTLTKLTAFDDSGKAKLVFFNQRYIKDTLITGSTFRFYGKLTVQNGTRTLTSPAYERVQEGVPLPMFKPLYHLTAGLTQNIVSSLIKNVLGRVPEYPDILGEERRGRLGLISPNEAFRLIHDPASFEDIQRAQSYFVFEELYIFALCIEVRKRGAKSGHAAIYAASERKFQCFTDALPYKLTGAQNRAIAEIRADLASGMPMRRLLSGDVGSGKTVVAAAAIYIAVSNGAQAALMAPTDILARQHYADLAPLFDSFRLRTALITGSVSAAERRASQDALKSGDIQIAIGTHALISESVGFKNLGLVITDEQHRFGVVQREAMAAKGERGCHTLIMSATPIPRSLALVIYGDLDLSALDELPPGRQRVDTFVVDGSYSPRLDAFIAKQIELGGRVYVVCPSIEASEKEDGEGEGEFIPFGYDYSDEAAANSALPLKNAVDEAERLRGILRGISVGCMHGRMRGTEKDAVMRAFADGGIQVLVSTTVIEVGVNVPEATLMIINNAERFGLSQLHQMRGRVGRGKAKSYCVLVSDSGSAVTRERLNVMRETGDGYEIAKRDLELRGPGDFLPSKSGEARQSGEFRFRTASLVSDMDTLKLAAAEAQAALEADPTFSAPENSAASDRLAQAMGM